MNAPTTTVPLARRYPIPAPQSDDRFTFGLFLDVARTLQDHGYPALTSMDLVDLGQALYRLLYTPDHEDHQREVAATDASIAQGAEIDAAVEFTGHLPGHYDTDPDAAFHSLTGEDYHDSGQGAEDDAEREYYRRERLAEYEAERAEWREMAAHHPTITHAPEDFR